MKYNKKNVEIIKCCIGAGIIKLFIGISVLYNSTNLLFVVIV